MQKKFRPDLSDYEIGDEDKMEEITLEHILSMTTETKNSCLEWNGRSNKQGYARIGKNDSVARLVLEITGRDMTGLYACHKCDNPPCVNPDHLFPGTALDNRRDAQRKGRLVGMRRVVEFPDHFRPDLTSYLPYIDVLTDKLNEGALYKMSKTDAIKIAIESALQKISPDVVVNKTRKKYVRLNF